MANAVETIEDRLFNLLTQAVENASMCEQMAAELRRGFVQRDACLELHKRAVRFRALQQSLRGAWGGPIGATLAPLDDLKLSHDLAELKNEHLGTGLANIELYQANWKTAREILQGVHRETCKVLGDWAIYKAQIAASVEQPNKPLPQAKTTQPTENVARTQAPAKRRGKTSTVSHIQKREALECKSRGGLNRECARIWYSLDNPTGNQIKSMSTNLSRLVRNHPAMVKDWAETDPDLNQYLASNFSVTGVGKLG